MRRILQGLVHNVRVVLVHWRAEAIAAAEYRSDFLSGTLLSAVWLGFAVAPALILFDHVDSAAGWTLPRLLFMQAIWYGLDAFMWMFIFPNVGKWSEKVQTGRLDILLLKPADSLTMASIGSVDPHNIPKVGLAVVLAVATVVVSGGLVSVVNVLAGVVAIAAAFMLLWALGVLTSVKAITSVKFDASFSLHTAHNLARVPTPFYGAALRILLTAVVPVAFLTTVPAEVFYGSTSLWMAAVALVVAVGVATLARLAWKHQIRRYAGAMG